MDILIVATVVVYFAIGMQYQAQWASDMCQLAQPICDTFYFYWLLTATAVVAIFFLLSRMIDT